LGDLEQIELRGKSGLVRALASLVAAKVALNPHTQDPRMRHPKFLHEPVGRPPILFSKSNAHGPTVYS